MNDQQFIEEEDDGAGEALVLPYRYEPRYYQQPMWNFFERGGKRAAAVWHRRAGKDLFAVNLICCSAMERVGLYWHLFPTYSQGRKIAWDGRTKDGRAFIDYIPKELRDGDPNATEMKVKLTTGSIYQVVGADNIDRLVGSNPVGVVLSEWSLIDPRVWDFLRPILRENEGWALFIYTPRGHNHGYTLYNMARGNPKWFCEKLGIKETKVLAEEDMEEERAAGMPEELIQQEFYCSFEAGMAGSYYGSLIERAKKDGRVGLFPHDPYLDVHTAWDLGMNDEMVIWFFQVVQGVPKIIDYYSNSGEGLAHYARVLREKEYTYGYHLAPHDIEVRELGTGVSRKQAAKELGIKFRTVKKLGLLDGIEAVRSILPMCHFNEKPTEHGLQALMEYSKTYDEKLKVFKEHPIHNWASHPADGFRILAVGANQYKLIRANKFQDQLINRQAQTEYDPYAPNYDAKRRKKVQRSYLDA